MVQAAATAARRSQTEGKYIKECFRNRSEYRDSAAAAAAAGEDLEDIWQPWAGEEAQHTIQSHPDRHREDFLEHMRHIFYRLSAYMWGRLM